VDAENAAPIERAGEIDLHHRFRRRLGAWRDASAGAIRGAKVAPLRRLTGEDGIKRQGDKDQQAND